jgi:hypothetical protein
MEHNLSTVFLAGGLVCAVISCWTVWNSRFWFGGAAIACGFAYMLFR